MNQNVTITHPFRVNKSESNFLTERSNSKNKYLLHTACSRGKLDTVKFYLDDSEYSYKINQLNKVKMTPLD